jgi:hypothetical protein
MKLDVTWEETLASMDVRLKELNEKAKPKIEQIEKKIFKEEDEEKNFAFLLAIAKRMEDVGADNNTFINRHKNEYDLICLGKESTKDCLLLFNALTPSERVAFARCLSGVLLPAWRDKIERCQDEKEKIFYKAKFEQLMFFYRRDMLIYLTEKEVDEKGLPKKRTATKPDLKDVM